MKIKKTCKGKIKMTLSHKEAVVIAKALDMSTLQDKDTLGVEDINVELFDRDEFEDTFEWDIFEIEVWRQLEKVLYEYIPH